MKVFYTEHAGSEYDYVLKDILSNIEKDVELFNKSNMLSLLHRTDMIQRNILVVNDDCKLEDIVAVAKHIQPRVIIYLSDETGTHQDRMIIEQYTPVFFRQYNHKHYTYGSNNYQMPLGYLKYYLKGNCSSIPKKMADRTINCSFIGTPKSDRVHMLNLFYANMKNTMLVPVKNNWNFENMPVSQQTCFETYSQSIFVINGRGNCSLDCFRIYEAIVAGAIPVIVGSVEEINTTFHYNNKRPPLMYEESWEKALVRCNTLLGNLEALQKLQDELLTWWKDQHTTIHSLIRTALTDGTL
jgi:hypothetical protein